MFTLTLVSGSQLAATSIFIALQFSSTIKRNILNQCYNFICNKYKYKYNMVLCNSYIIQCKIITLMSSFLFIFD